MHNRILFSQSHHTLLFKCIKQEQAENTHYANTYELLYAGIEVCNLSWNAVILKCLISLRNTTCATKGWEAWRKERPHTYIHTYTHIPYATKGWEAWRKARPQGSCRRQQTRVLQSLRGLGKILWNQTCKYCTAVRERIIFICTVSHHRWHCASVINKICCSMQTKSQDSDISLP